MISKLFDWYESHPLHGIIALLFLLVMLLGGVFYNAAHSAPARITLPNSITWQDRDTLSLALGSTHQVCWSDGNASQSLRINIYRYRVEDSVPRRLALGLDKAGWTASPEGGYCQPGFKPPKTGHWIYEAEICTLDTVPMCSDTVTAACAAGTSTECVGAVRDTPRGWWVYVFLPAPTGVGS
jgi:hypothetical protein